MASRFWTQGGSDSEEEEEEVESSEEEESEDEGKAAKEEGEGEGAVNRYKESDSDSDSDEDRGRVVKPAKERRMDEMVSTVDQIKNAVKINDWVALQESFEKLNKQLEKVTRVTESSAPPRQYIKGLVLLEDHLTQALANKEAKKKMSSSNAKALNTMKQKLKKNNKQYEAEMDKFRQKPESEGEEDDEEESEESDEEDAESVEDPLDRRGATEGEEADGEGWETTKSKKDRDMERQFRRDHSEIKWEEVQGKMKEILAARGRKGTDRAEQVEQLAYLARVAKTPAQKLEVMMHVISAQFDVSTVLAALPVPVWKRCVQNLFLALDILEGNHNIVMDDTQGPEADTEEAEKESAKGPDFEGTIHLYGSLVVFLERVDDELFKSLQCTDPYTKEYVERLKDEPLLLALAEGVQAYAERIGDVKGATRVALRRIEHIYYKPQAVYEAMRAMAAAGEDRLAVTAGEEEDLELEGDDEEGAVPGESARRRKAMAAAAAAAAVSASEAGPAPFVGTPEVVLRQPAFPPSSRAFMDQLTKLVYRDAEERIKARAMLCDIFHRAVNEDYYKAKDMMLMSHLQDAVPGMDISTQILLNRAMAQLGLAAFRAALIPEAHACLGELFASGRVKELLAQGVQQSRYHDKTPEQERMERRRQMPYHMHINLELLEAVHLLACMLLEVPQLAASPLLPSGDSQRQQQQRKPMSKNFRRLLETYERQTFTGPPENVRDHIMAATRAMMRADWRAAAECAEGLQVWRLLPDSQRERVLGVVRHSIQEEALRTYLFAAPSCYTSLSLDQLVEMFELPEKAVVNRVSQMIMADELEGSWDQPTRTVYLHALQPSRLQLLAMQYSDKLNVLIDSNERALSERTGGLGMESGGGGRHRGRDRGDDRGGDYGGRREDYGGERQGGWSGGRGRGGGRRDGGGGYGGGRGGGYRGGAGGSNFRKGEGGRGRGGDSGSRMVSLGRSARY